MSFTKYIINIIIVSTLSPLVGCGGTLIESDGDPQTILNEPTEVIIDEENSEIVYESSNFVGSLSEATASDLVSVTGTGMDTYKTISVVMVNRSSKELKVTMNAGTFFQNPSNSSQSLITTQVFVVEIAPDETKKVTVPSACTNAQLMIPGENDNWPVSQAPDGLDNALKFYGIHEARIGNFLAKKNPEKLGTMEGRRAFLQVAIWNYTGNKSEDIIEMLANHVFEHDVTRAQLFYREVSEDAQRFAQLLRDKDDNALRQWVHEQSELLEERGKAKVKEARNRIRNRFHN